MRVHEGDRRLWIYLPPSYERDGRPYPVVFAHDGQNLFDTDTSHAGEWRVDETMETLAAEGLEAIVVGIENSGGERMTEYSPFTGTGEAYVSYVVDEVRALVARDFRIAREPERTGVLGSSAGGTISLYAIAERPDVFGFAGVLSPAFWWLGERMFEWIGPRDMRGRIYMDIGGLERGVEGMHRMAALLRTKTVELRVVEEPGAPHNEEAWARRLPEALRFLLGGREPPDSTND
ncbi:MAG TPA: alpha/beta hydrolase-fold protein [Gaiellaceae bacterium]|nr:alpha/beta hydrolase-fold protein [Gaiellaceae bacterium]